MEDSSVPPVPRLPRDRAQLSTRRHKTPHTISTADVNRDFDRDVKRHRHPDRHSERERERLAPTSPASPEVISSLITSLAVISKPASNHFDGPSYLDSASVLPPPSRPEGSFGVDYGAFAQPSLDDLREEDTPLDEIAATPPVIRTSKPPSGYSALTAPKSPKSPHAKDGSALKSLLLRKGSSSALSVSRPSSKGSLVSVPGSIGNLSIERGSASPAAESRSLKTQRSQDSWGKKTGRAHKGLMYMSSKERLREQEEKKRAGFGTSAGASSLLSPPISPRADPLLAESTINEESAGDSPTQPEGATAAAEASRSASGPHLIPARDSSLRRSGSHPKSSTRAPRVSKRDNDPGSNTIHETDEEPHHSSRHQHGDTSRRRAHGVASGEDKEPTKKSVTASQRSKTKMSPKQTAPDTTAIPPAGATVVPARAHPTEYDLDEGAPAPAVAQGRRRDREASADARNRRWSGRQTPDPLGGYTSEGGGVGVKPKRSSSRLKRLSGAASPTLDTSSSDHGARASQSTQADQPQVAYERPRSADSIDDTVESYLCSPRLSQKIRHPQTGRVISFSEVGDPNGSAVFCCVGMGLTRYITAFYDELALTLKLRLITPDRPGIGDSEPYAEGTPLGWPDDVYAICQSLRITKFSILAHSAGAIYALATALRMPQHIRGRIHLLAPWIPPSQMSVFGASTQTPLPPTNAIPTSQRILRALPTPILRVANSSFMTTTSSSITSSLPKQKRAKRERRSNVVGGGGKDKGGKAAASRGLEDKENQEIGVGNENNSSTSAAAAKIGSVDMAQEAGTFSASASAAHIAANGNRHQRSNSAGQRAMAASADLQESDHQMLSVAASQADADLADRERQQIYDSRLTHAIWQLATTGANPAVDLLVCLERNHTIGFRYVDITRPVTIQHGSRDTRVPVDNVRWLGKTMRRCEVRVLEGEGHGLMASAQVMGNVLMEISREWEEWGRVTGATKREYERSRRGTIGQTR